MNKMKETFKEILNEAKVANMLVLVTHDGLYHTDDLAVTALAKLIAEKQKINTRVIRTRDKDKVPSGGNVLIYDVFDTILDHHKEDTHVDGRCLSSIGKFWRFAKTEIIDTFQINEFLWREIDKDVISYIDLTDNTGLMNPFNYVINAIRNLDDKDLELAFTAAGVSITLDKGDSDEDFTQKRFKFCVKYLMSIFTVILENAKRKMNESKEFEKLPILVINGRRFKFSDRHISGAPDKKNIVEGIIWRTDKGTVGVKTFSTFSLKVSGLSTGEIPGVIYVHKNGKNGEVEKIEDLNKIL